MPFWVIDSVLPESFQVNTMDSNRGLSMRAVPSALKMIGPSSAGVVVHVPSSHSDVPDGEPDCGAEVQCARSPATTSRPIDRSDLAL